jgi:branched-chain amino acid transport system substrate-binding protein
MKFAKINVAGAAALLLATALGWPSAYAQSEPIRVGFLSVRTGALAAGGKQMEQGIELFLKQRNHTLGGRKVELVIADTGGNPAGAKTKMQELVERHRAHVVLGPLAAFEALAIDDYIRQTQTPTVSCSAAADDLTQRKPNPWFVRTVATSSQPYYPLGDYAAKTLGYKRIAIIADDFAYGYETAAGFQRGFEDAGGKIVQKLWPPLNVADYGSYIAQIKPDVDAIWAGFAGANGLRFLKQYKDYGMKIPVLGSMTTTDEGILHRMGDEALGVVTAGWYAAGLDSPENKAFVAAINKEYGADPGYYTLGCYSAGALVELAAKAVNAKVEDKSAFMKALRTPGAIKDARGEWRIDEFGNPIMPIHVRKVERRGGKLVNSVVKTYPNVSQFWSYDQKQYLAAPAYSRDYPPTRFLGQ